LALVRRNGAALMRSSDGQRRCGSPADRGACTLRGPGGLVGAHAWAKRASTSARWAGPADIDPPLV